jgi:succinate-acetate transporter protein
MAAAIVSDTIRGLTGIFVLTIALLAAGMGVAALRKNRLLAAIFFVLALAYLCDGLGIWTQPLAWFVAIGGNATVVSTARSGWLLIVGGYAGMVAALLAFYGAIALMVNSASGQERWPIFGARPQSAAPRPAEA